MPVEKDYNALRSRLMDAGLPQLDFLKSQGLLPEHKVMDFGCGVLRGGLRLIEYLNPGNYHGVEIRKEILADAAEVHAGSQWGDKRIVLVEDYRIRSTRFDYIWAFSTFPSLTDRELEEFLSYARTALAPDGRLYGTFRLGPHEDGTWQSSSLLFPFNRRPAEFYAGIAERAGFTFTQVRPEEEDDATICLLT